MNIKRKPTFQVQVGNIIIGSKSHIVVQSMTNTDTEDVNSTVKQILELYKAGSEIVRITVNTIEAGHKVREIKEKLLSLGCNVPIVGDFHFNGHKILEASPDCAKYLDKYRINPGNIGKGAKKDEQFAYMINAAIKYNKPIRIGVNWGSLDQELLAQMMDENQKIAKPLDVNTVMKHALVESALRSAKKAIELGLKEDKIVLSCKVSHVNDLIDVYKDLSAKCDYPLHLGLTEAGMGEKGIVASSVAISNLLFLGIGDTIRVSITPKPGESRNKEVQVAQEILQTMDLRAFVPQVTACPGCGRTSSDYFQRLALQVQDFLKLKMPEWKNQYTNEVANMKIAVMGCVVNGPGESKLANIGISLPGKDESPVAPVYVNGEKFKTLKGDNIISEFKLIIEEYVESTYSKK